MTTITAQFSYPYFSELGAFVNPTVECITRPNCAGGGCNIQCTGATGFNLCNIPENPTPDDTRYLACDESGLQTSSDNRVLNCIYNGILNTINIYDTHACDGKNGYFTEVQVVGDIGSETLRQQLRIPPKYAVWIQWVG